MKKIYITLGVMSMFLLLTVISFAQCPQYCFSTSTNNGCRGVTVVFTNTSTDPNAYRFDWSFGDGTPTYTTTVPTNTVSHTYSVSGYYSPAVNVYDITGSYLGFTYGNSGNIQVNGFTLNISDSVCPGDNAGMCAYTNQGNLNTSFWKFGDGATYNITNGNSCTSHTYTAQGTYTVTVIATPNGCPQDSVKKQIVSNPNARPNVNWWINGSTPVCPNQQLNFSTDPAASYTWNFGDGSATSNVQQPMHSYTTTGTYSVTLTKTNVCGKTGSYTNTVMVSSNVHFPNQNWFQLRANGSPACPNSDIGFDAPGGYGTYQWDFGDGTPVVSGSDSHPNHLYGSTIKTYTVSVKITNACNIDTTIYTTAQISATAPFPNQSWFHINTNSNVSCPNTEIHFNAPGGFAKYEWNYGDGSALEINPYQDGNHSYTSLGTYTVSVKITNGCNNDTTIYGAMQISNNAGFPSGMQLYMNNPYCKSSPVEIQAPSGFSSYVWNFGDGATATTTKDRASHTYTATGSYPISVQITNGCAQTTTVNGTAVVDNTGSFPSNGNGNNLQIEISPNNHQSCPNDIVTFSINSDVYSSYDWDFGDGVTASTNGREIQHSYTAAATYSVSCKITNGCGLFTTLYSYVDVNGAAPINPSVYVASIQNPACVGDKVYMIPQNGQTSYKYYWDFGDGGKDTSGAEGAIHAFTTTGNHTVSVTIENGCGSSSTISFVDTIKVGAKPSLLLNGSPIWGIPGGEGGGVFTAGCAGDAVIFYFMGESAVNLWDFGDGNTGQAVEHMVVSGGDGGSYPVTIIKHAFAANGTYTVSLTLTNNCGNSVSDTMVVNIGGNLQVDGEMSTSPPPFTTCAPVNFIGFGGKSYLWNFGDGNTLNSSSPTISHTYAAQGAYVVTVQMTNGCGSTATYSKSITVSGVGGPAVALTGSVIPTCVGSSNGSATVTVNSGQLPYTYLWNDANAQTTAAATGLHAGMYNVVVTDGFGCPSNLVVQLNDPSPIALASSTAKTNCGAATGSATVTVTSGGTAPYTYNWSNGSTTSTAIGLGYGIYNVQVSDSKGCSSSSNVSVSEANAASVALTSVSNVSCNAGSNGSINITVTGGTPPYAYVWSNGSTAEDPTSLSAGTYSVIVTDNGSCKATFNATIAEPSPVVISTSVVSAPTCGNFDGKATANATGGTGAYTYLWDLGAGNQTTQVASALPAGSYSVVVTDSKGCSSNGAIGLSNSNAPTLSSVVSDVSCFGGSNGSINLSIIGGTSPYLYTWNVPGQVNNQDVFGLAPGNYFVSVEDKMNCKSYALYTIAQPAVLTASVTNTGATCGNSDGTATADVSGGNSPYSYLWTGGKTTQAIGSLALGTYTVGVTDSKGCTTSSSTTITATASPISICGISVDSTSTKNVIVWEKPVATNIDSFKIYRLINSAYTYIGHVAYSALSTFTDNTNGVNPNTAAYKYEVRTRDICGNESVLSSYHQTMHLQVGVAAPPNSFNLSWNDYVGFPVSQYRIMVDSVGDGSWYAKDSVSFGNPLSWTDNHHYGDTVSYMIEIAHPTGCVVSIKNPEVMASNLNLSKSNINRVRDTSIHPFVKNITNELIVNMYPNPTNGLFTIDLKEHNQGATLVKVFSVLGEEVKPGIQLSNKNKVVVDMSKQAKGVYYVQISSSGKITTRKIIIE